MALAITSLRLALSTFSVRSAEAVVDEDDGLINFLVTQDLDFINTQSGIRINLGPAIGEDGVVNALLTQDGDFITTQSGKGIRLEGSALLHTQSNARIITEADDAILLHSSAL